MPFVAAFITGIVGIAFGYLLRGSHINQQAEDYIRELHAHLSLAIARDEKGLRAGVTSVVNELDGIVHRL